MLSSRSPTIPVSPASTCAAGAQPCAFGSLFERAEVCVTILDLDLRVSQANGYFAETFETSAGGRGRYFYEFLHPSLRAKFTRQFSQLVRGDKNYFVEHVVAFGVEQRFFGGELAGIAVRGKSGVEGIMVLVEPRMTGHRDRETPGVEARLSPVDARIVEGIAAGASTTQVAAMLHLSRSAVEYHVTALLRRLQVVNRTSLISKAYSMGLLEVGQWPPRVVQEYLL